jgi:hypothetical protein
MTTKQNKKPLNFHERKQEYIQRYYNKTNICAFIYYFLAKKIRVKGWYPSPRKEKMALELKGHFQRGLHLPPSKGG